MPRNRLIKYLRLSKANGRSASIEEQDACLTALGEVHGLVTVRTITDDDRSASAYAQRDREGWPELLAAVANGEADYIGLWEQSRATRELAVYAELRDLCERHGVKWLTNEGIVDPANDGQRLSSGVRALLDEQASRDTSKRVRRNVAARAEAGKPHGRNLYGYRRIYGADRSLERVEIVEEEAAVLRWMAERVLAGASITSIVHALNEQRVPMANAAVAARVGREVEPGKGWIGRQVKRSLVRPEYAGLRTHRGQVVGTGQWPALWDDLTHRRLVAVLTDPSRGEARSSELKHYLSGLIECGHCGAGLRVTANRPHGGAAYWCQTPGCRKVAVSKSDVEPAIGWLVLQAVRDPRFIRDDTANVAALRSEAESLRLRMAEAESAFVAGDLSAALLARVEKELKAKIGELEAALARTDVPMEVPTAEVLAERWEAISAAERRHIAKVALGRIVLGTAGRKRVPILSRLTFPDLGISPFALPEPETEPLTLADPLYSREAAADRLGVTFSSLHAWMREGRLRSLREGRERWVSVVDVERLLAERTPPWAA